MPAVVDLPDFASELLSDALVRVETAGERVILTRDGKPVAAVVPLSDMEALETLEDAKDSTDAAAALADWVAAGRPPGASLEQLAVRHGIDLGTPIE